MERHDEPYGTTIYMVDWKTTDDNTVWRANFLTYEAYEKFANRNTDIVIVKEDYRVI